jgi:hypothetical protein
VFNITFCDQASSGLARADPPFGVTAAAFAAISLGKRNRLICAVSADRRPKRDPVLADMQVIVRLQDRGALRLDHLHDQALCEPEGRGDLRSPT